MASVPSRPVPVRVHLRAWVTALLAAVLVLAPGVPALAAPGPGDIEAQIDDAWNKLEPVIEEYNRVHVQLQDTQTKIDALSRQMAPLQMQVDLAMARVGTVSARLYEIGPGSRITALLQAGNPAMLADQLTSLDALARQQANQVSATVAMLDTYQTQKKPLDDLRAQLAAQDTDLANKKAGIQKQLDDLQKLRLAAYGAGGPATGNLRPVACPMEYFGDKGSQAAKKACSLIGKPYIFGAAGPTGYDCSGLTLAAWASVGVTLQHYTGWQWNEGKPVTRANIRPGDLVFWFPDLHHMGIYVGGGWVVHAPHTGDFVRMAPMDRAGLPLAGIRRPG